MMYLYSEHCKDVWQWLPLLAHMFNSSQGSDLIKSFRKMTSHEKRQSFITHALSLRIYDPQWKVNCSNVCQFKKQSGQSISIATVAKANHSTAKSLGCKKNIKVFMAFLIQLSHRKTMYNTLYWTRVSTQVGPIHNPSWVSMFRPLHSAVHWKSSFQLNLVTDNHRFFDICANLNLGNLH